MSAEMRSVSVRSIIEESVGKIFEKSTKDKLLEIVTINAEQKSIELITNVSPQVPDEIIADSERLRKKLQIFTRLTFLGQIIVNLLSNSVKFSTYGDIVVSAEVKSYENQVVVLLFSVKGKENSYKIPNTILDQGIGIPQEVQKNIFQPFYQADVSVSRKFGGTGKISVSPFLTFSGLGLTICKRLAEMHKGTIWFTSQEGQGSTFYFTIKVSVSADAPKVIPWASGEVVVIVEPSFGLGNVLKERVSQWGFHVLVCNDAESAEKLLSDRVSILIVSVNDEFIVTQLVFISLKYKGID
jgi:two-component system sensor histidine kinase/response regulator